MYLKDDKPWDGNGMYGQAFKLRFHLSRKGKSFVRINGHKFFIDDWSWNGDAIILRDGNKTVHFYRAERDWVDGGIPKGVRGKWSLSSVTTTYKNV